MKINNSQRPVADKTRYNIIKAARTLFAKHGFSGTSTIAIATAAKVNETLIFHHFGNKEKLWKTVKAQVVDNITCTPLNSQPSSLVEFLAEVINQRLLAYQQKPELARLIRWQQMEAKPDNLIAGNTLAPNNWLPAIHHLQLSGKINKAIPAEFIMLWLTASINTLIFDRISLLQPDATRKAYVDFLLRGFERALT